MKKNNLPLSLGEILKNLRGTASQAKTAVYFGIAQQTYAGWESNKRKPDIIELRSIAIHYAVSTDYLLGLTDDPTPRSAPSGHVNMNGVQAVNSTINTRDMSVNSTTTPPDADILARLTRLETLMEAHLNRPEVEPLKPSMY